MSNQAKIEDRRLFRSIPAAERAEGEPAGYGLEWPQAVSQWLPQANYRGLVDGDTDTAAWRGREIKFREGWALGDFLCFGDDKTLMRRVRISSARSHKLKFKEDLTNASNNRLDRSRAESEGKVFFEVLFYRAADHAPKSAGDLLALADPADMASVDPVAQLADWIFERHQTGGQRPMKALLQVAKREPGSVKRDDFAKAFGRVYETKRGKPPVSGWPLREPYQIRLAQKTTAKNKML